MTHNPTAAPVSQVSRPAARHRNLGVGLSSAVEPLSAASHRLAVISFPFLKRARTRRFPDRLTNPPSLLK
jgi:hypothetical protein